MDEDDAETGDCVCFLTQNNLAIWEQCQEVANAYHGQRNAIFCFNNRPLLNWTMQVQVRKQSNAISHFPIKVRYCMPRGRKVRSRTEVKELAATLREKDVELFDFSGVYCVCHEWPKKGGVSGDNNNNDFLECRIGTAGCNKVCFFFSLYTLLILLFICYI